jgi:hypothetical protein
MTNEITLTSHMHCKREQVEHVILWHYARTHCTTVHISE